MKRRTYLATATALAVAGCTGSDDDDHLLGNDGSDGDGSDGSDGGGSDGSDGGGSDGDGESDGSDEPEEPDEPDDPAEAETFDDFEDLSLWTAEDGSLSADESRSHVGAQSALLEVDESETDVRIVRSFTSPVDLSGMSPTLAMAADLEIAPTIQLFDADGNKISFRQEVTDDAPLVRENFGISYVSNEPDLSEVMEIHILMWVGEETAGKLWIDDLQFVDRPDTGRVMLQFGGGFESHYAEALPILEEYDYPATAFVPPGRLRAAGEGEDEAGDESGTETEDGGTDDDGDGTEGDADETNGTEEEDATEDGTGTEAEADEAERLTVDQLEALSDAGWTIGSEGEYGSILPQLDEDGQTDRIVDAKEWLEANGYEEGAKYFSYPVNRYDETTVELVDEHHDLGFAGRFPAQGRVANPALCSRVYDPAADDAREMLDLTAERGGITTLTYSDLEGASLAAFEATMAYLNDLESRGDLEVVTPRDVAENHTI